MAGVEHLTNPDQTRRAIKALSSYDFLEYEVGEVNKPVIIRAVHDIARIALSQFANNPPSFYCRQTDADRLFADEFLPKIQRLTSPGLVNHRFYEGDSATLAEVWCLATAKSKGFEMDIFTFDGDMTVIAFGDNYGPWKCEKDGCEKVSSNVYVTREEYKALLYKPGSAGMARCVIGGRAGKVLCRDDAPKLISGDVDGE